MRLQGDVFWQTFYSKFSHCLHHNLGLEILENQIMKNLIKWRRNTYCNICRSSHKIWTYPDPYIYHILHLLHYSPFSASLFCSSSDSSYLYRRNLNKKFLLSPSITTQIEYIHNLLGFSNSRHMSNFSRLMRYFPHILFLFSEEIAWQCRLDE